MDQKSKLDVEGQNKYDRQLRIWGAHGQKKLAESHICLLGTEAAGVEALKNLALPGLGQFMIVDEAKVCERDLGNNFFVSEENIGQNKAEVICANILEMNNDVKGKAIVKNISVLIKEEEKSPSFFKQFNMVIANQLQENDLVGLSKVCQTLKIHLINVYTDGLIGYTRIFGNDHFIKETKPADIMIVDLRIMKPFPELLDHCMQYQIETLDIPEHMHVPYVIILIQNIQKWKKEHNNELPKNFQEKTIFNEQIKKQSNNLKNELNYQEALKNSYLSFQDPEQLSEEIKSIFAQLEHMNVTRDSDPFWILTKAFSIFYKEHQCLPLLGKLADMTAFTQYYIKLLEIYQTKAEQDRNTMRKIMDKFLNENSVNVISDEELRSFCENCQTLNFVLYKPYHEEVKQIKIGDYFETPNYKWYFCIRGCQRFFDRHQRYPSDNDAEELMKIINGELLKTIIPNENNQINEIEKEYIEEICRYSGSIIHGIASFIGGVASQEAIKLITKQFLPINNTFIYDGIQCVSEVYQF